MRRLHAIAIVFVGLLTASGAAGPPLCEPELEAHLGGQANDIVVHNGLAYIANGLGGLLILDVSDPKAITPVGSLHTGTRVLAVGLVDGHAYLGSYLSDGLIVVDVEDPSKPWATGTVDFEGDGEDMALDGSTMYVAAGDAGLLVFDVSNPGSPVEIGALPNSNGMTWAVDVEFVDGLLYLGQDFYYPQDNNGLKVVDVSDPTAPSVVGEFELQSGAIAMGIAGGVAYVNDDFLGFSLVDVSEPTKPTLIKTDHDFDNVNGIAIDGDVAYFWVYGDLLVLDVSEPASPKQIGAIDGLGSVLDAWIEGGVAYLGLGDFGTRTLDVSDPTMPAALGEYAPPAGPDAIKVEGGFAYIADDWGGFKVVSLANPALPAVVSQIDTNGVARDVHVAGPLAYVASSTGLQVIDVADPFAPVLIGSASTQLGAFEVTVGDGAAYAALYDGSPPTYTIAVFDVSMPTAPQLIATKSLLGFARDLALDDGILYVAEDSKGLQTIDVTDPANPISLGNLHNTMAMNLQVRDGLAFITNGDANDKGFQIIDVSSPAQPTLVSTTVIPGSVGSLRVVGNRAFVSSNVGLRVFDVSDPAAPVEVGAAPIKGGVSAADTAYVYMSAGGLAIVDVAPCVPPTCPDIDGSGSVDSTDVNLLLADFACVAEPAGDPCVGDLDQDGDTDSMDLNLLLVSFGCRP